MSSAMKMTIGVICFFILTVVTIVIPFQQVEKNELSWTNNELSELKQSRGVNHLELDDLEVKKILDDGEKYGVSELKSAMKISVSLIAIYTIILGAFIYRMRVKG